MLTANGMLNISVNASDNLCLSSCVLILSINKMYAALHISSLVLDSNEHLSVTILLVAVLMMTG